MTSRVFSLAALTVLELPPPQMIFAAAQAGYSHVGLRLEPATAQEHHFPLMASRTLRCETAQALRDTGVKVLDVEILRLKPETDVAFFEPYLEVGAELGASELLVAGNDADQARLTARFAQLCELARGYGIYPHLEFMPWTDVPDLANALEVVEAAAQPNGCILVDAFHFNRSCSSLELLERACKQAPERFRYLQLCDVLGPVPASMDEILRQARHERRFPGDGDCDLQGLLAALPPGIAISVEAPTVQAPPLTAQQRAAVGLQKTLEVLRRIPSPA
ncbi:MULTISPECIES: sugar phosphate isomerase/epimerase [unclassified Pseudomonas]|uniref:sugar phosphate isomerase/epimerase family protein n=1 Tax=unclassified Pseudomonas TaxID=196821 RepID=UPI000BC4FC39|nr:MULTISPECIES: sugar phosphate isomerase/epimerase [unclassified Pseudomonas]PVZ19664.1 sugar phosphate isomerase/epimerase [Pseudomonas sp. URIL14HWK12:I12]PVZ22751.1 sugar phosphate isomerase/epimerase [Pseudomonas sp. URIL14HWK12:I10]PVZ37619.1 sugar phosphate isomerase/epimerase [Pseudomonas sp. URIL14HWK12:I11]SNZ15263.1 Sugar phosphate isomerase/epimerase [Pseudomonas sp. URIL14HWK12:I9]